MKGLHKISPVEFRAPHKLYDLSYSPLNYYAKFKYEILLQKVLYAFYLKKRIVLFIQQFTENSKFILFYFFFYKVAKIKLKRRHIKRKAAFRYASKKRRRWRRKKRKRRQRYKKWRRLKRTKKFLWLPKRGLRLLLVYLHWLRKIRLMSKRRRRLYKKKTRLKPKLNKHNTSKFKKQKFIKQANLKFKQSKKLNEVRAKKQKSQKQAKKLNEVQAKEQKSQKQSKFIKRNKAKFKKQKNIKRINLKFKQSKFIKRHRLSFKKHKFLKWNRYQQHFKYKFYSKFNFWYMWRKKKRILKLQLGKNLVSKQLFLRCPRIKNFKTVLSMPFLRRPYINFKIWYKIRGARSRRGSRRQLFKKKQHVFNFQFFFCQFFNYYFSKPSIILYKSLYKIILQNQFFRNTIRTVLYRTHFLWRSKKTGRFIFDMLVATHYLFMFADTNFLFPIFIRGLVVERKHYKWIILLFNMLRQFFIIKKGIKAITIFIKGTYDKHARARSALFSVGQLKLTHYDSAIIYDALQCPTFYGMFFLKLWIYWEEHEMWN